MVLRQWQVEACHRRGYSISGTTEPTIVHLKENMVFDNVKVPQVKILYERKAIEVETKEGHPCCPTVAGIVGRLLANSGETL